MAFVGIGAAVGGALTDHRGWDLALAGALAGLVGAVAAVVVGYPALRRGGLTLAVSTLAFGLFVSQYGSTAPSSPTGCRAGASTAAPSSGSS